jgi:hypothetical protein
MTHHQYIAYTTHISFAFLAGFDISQDFTILVGFLIDLIHFPFLVELVYGT